MKSYTSARNTILPIIILTIATLSLAIACQTQENVPPPKATPIPTQPPTATPTYPPTPEPTTLTRPTPLFPTPEPELNTPTPEPTPTPTTEPTKVQPTATVINHNPTATPQNIANLITEEEMECIADNIGDEAASNLQDNWVDQEEWNLSPIESGIKMHQNDYTIDDAIQAIKCIANNEAALASLKSEDPNLPETVEPDFTICILQAIKPIAKIAEAVEAAQEGTDQPTPDPETGINLFFNIFSSTLFTTTYCIAQYHADPSAYTDEELESFDAVICLANVITNNDPNPELIAQTIMDDPEIFVAIESEVSAKCPNAYELIEELYTNNVISEIDTNQP